jgi:hypothetical protein
MQGINNIKKHLLQLTEFSVMKQMKIHPETFSSDRLQCEDLSRIHWDEKKPHH